MKAPIEIKEGLVSRGEIVIARLELLNGTQVVVSEKKLPPGDKGEINKLLGSPAKFFTSEEFAAVSAPIEEEKEVGETEAEPEKREKAKKTQKAAPTDVSGDEPASDFRGDLTPDVVEYRKAAWPADQFDSVYPHKRLKEAGFIHLM